jgi:hypothetical protein
MEFIFVCPTENDTFQTDAFSIIDNQGVRTSRDGTKHLDAKVRLDIPCPLCGEQHIYSADEMLCPFEGDG